MTPPRGLGTALVATLGVAACASPVCPPGFDRAALATAYFGLGRGGDAASLPDTAWAEFLADTVTPAFPAGLTSLAGDGQWRSADGTIQREASRILHIILPGATATQAAARLAPITAAWRARHAQESVLTTIGAGCVGF